MLKKIFSIKRWFTFYSRCKVKFNVHKSDNMIIQSIALLDQLDKDVNTFSMRYVLFEFLNWISRKNYIFVFIYFFSEFVNGIPIISQNWSKLSQTIIHLPNVLKWSKIARNSLKKVNITLLLFQFHRKCWKKNRAIKTHKNEWISFMDLKNSCRFISFW